MKYSEIEEFNCNLRHFIIEGIFNEKHSYGQEWNDIPFPKANKIGIITTDDFTRGLNRIQKTYTSRMSPTENELPEIIKQILSNFDWRWGWDVYIREIPTKPSWKEIFLNLDLLIRDSADIDHCRLQQMGVVGDVLFFELVSF